MGGRGEYIDKMLTFFFEGAHKGKPNWRDITLCRKFFDEYAAEHRFDPLDAWKWSTVPLTDLVSRTVGVFFFLFHLNYNLNKEYNFIYSIGRQEDSVPSSRIQKRFAKGLSRSVFRPIQSLVVELKPEEIVCSSFFLTPIAFQCHVKRSQMCPTRIRDIRGGMIMEVKMVQTWNRIATL